MDLKDEVKFFKEELANFKKEMIMKTEVQFLKMKSQIAQIMEEISLQSQIIQNVKVTVTDLQSNLNDKYSLKHNSAEKEISMKEQTKITGAFGKENEIEEKKTFKGSKKVNEHATEFFSTPKCNILKNIKDLKKMDIDCFGDYTNGNHRVTFSHYSCQPKVTSCCLTCKSKERIIKKDRRKTKQTLARVKKLENIMNECLRYSSSFIESIMSQQLHDISEKIDENSFDLEQCWAETVDIKNKDTMIMLNGDFVKVEDEISRMNFELEALWTQTEEQSLLINQLQQKTLEKPINIGEVTVAWRQDIINALQNIVKTLQVDWRADITTSFLNFQKQVGKEKQRKFPIQWAKGTGKKLEDVIGSDTTLESGITKNCTTRHKCITAMTHYENWSLEELRHLDYEELDASALILPSFQHTNVLSFSNVVVDFNRTSIDQHLSSHSDIYFQHSSSRINRLKSKKKKK